MDDDADLTESFALITKNFNKMLKKMKCNKGQNFGKFIPKMEKTVTNFFDQKNK